MKINLLKTIAIVAGVMIATSAEAQWTTIFKKDSTLFSPPDTGYVKYPRHFSFADANTGYVVATAGTYEQFANNLWICKTTDGGATWSLPLPNKTIYTGGKNYNAISTISPLEFVLAAQDGRIFKSTDGGATISEAATNVVTNPRDIQFKGNFGIVHNGTNKLAYSTDKGSTWQQKTVVSVAFIDVVNATTAFIADGAQLLKTTDAGATWTTVALPVDLVAENYNTLKQISFVNETIGYVAVRKSTGTYDSKFLKTTDGGANWTNLTSNLPDSSSFSTFLAFDANTVYIISKDEGYSTGTTHKLRVSSDGGVTFTVDAPIWNTAVNTLKKADGVVFWSAESFADRIMKKGGGTLGVANMRIETLNVYPNPANTILNIKVNENTTVQIIDFLGATVATQKLNQGANSIDVSNLVKGVYFVKNENGGAVKFIKD